MAHFRDLEFRYLSLSTADFILVGGGFLADNLNLHRR